MNKALISPPTRSSTSDDTTIGALPNQGRTHTQIRNLPRLEDELQNATRRVSGRDQEFIPLDKFNQIITRESIQKEFQSCLPERPTNNDLAVWVNEVCDGFQYVDLITGKNMYTSRRKIFAVLVLLNVPERIKSFIKGNLWDKDLPFVKNTERKWVCHTNRCEEHIIECLNNPHEWSKRDAEGFGNFQWVVLSPIFNMAEGRVIFQSLHSRVPLPFIHESGLDEGDILGGGYADVSRVLIHPAHYRLDISKTDEPDAFAIKRLRSKDRRQFDAEVESLKRFSSGHYPHLIRLLATYRHGGYYHLIFPWAEGNLKHFWMKYPKPNKTYELALWIASQCRGIAKGLNLIHRDNFGKPSISPDDARKGRHGDIKPENILWFQDPGDEDRPWMGTLKISDFGLTRWHRDTSNRIIYINGLFVSPTYRAPESDLTQEIFQPWDIWTLACVYLEFLTWYLYGWNDGVDEFSKQRAIESSFSIPWDDFFNLGSKDKGFKYRASLKFCVVKWINRLHTAEGCSLFIHDFLDLISDSMLRIRYKERYKCEEVVAKLDLMYRKCRDDENYCFKSAHYIRRERKKKDSDRQDLQDMESMEFPEQSINTGDKRRLNSERQYKVTGGGINPPGNGKTDRWGGEHDKKLDILVSSVSNELYGQVVESPSELSPATFATPSNALITGHRTNTSKEQDNPGVSMPQQHDELSIASPLPKNTIHSDIKADLTMTRRGGGSHKTTQQDKKISRLSISSHIDSYHNSNIERSIKSSASVQLSHRDGQTPELGVRIGSKDGEALGRKQTSSERKGLPKWLKVLISCFQDSHPFRDK